MATWTLKVPNGPYTPTMVEMNRKQGPNEPWSKLLIKGTGVRGDPHRAAAKLYIKGSDHGSVEKTPR